MAGRKENLKALFSNTRTRIILLFTTIMLVTAVTVAYFKFQSKTPEDLSSARLGSTPVGISSIPGGLNPTAQYAKLVEQQNLNQAQTAIKKGGSAIPTIVRSQAFGEGVESVGPQGGRGGVGFSTLALEDTAGGQKSLWLQQLRDSNCSKSSFDSVMSEGGTLTQVKDACTCVQLRANGVPLQSLSKVCSCPDLKAAGVSAVDLRQSGYTAGQLRTCGYDACSLRAAGFSAQEMKDGGFSDDELKGAGFTNADIAAASGLPGGITAADVRNAGCNADALSRLRNAGVTASAVRRISGCSAAQLKAAGFTASELRNAGFSAADLKRAGFTPAELRAAGFDARSLLDAGFTPKDLSDAGYTPEEVAEAETRLPPGVIGADVRNAGCSEAMLRKERVAGVSANRIRQFANCTAEQLARAGFDANDLTNAGFTPKEIAAAETAAETASGLQANAALAPEFVPDSEVKAAGCDPAKLSALRSKGVSARRIRDMNGCSAASFKAAGFDAGSLIDAGFTPKELSAAGFTPAELRSAILADDADVKAAGCDPLKLKTLRDEGVSARRIRDLNGCSASAMKSAGFSATDLTDAGFTPQDLASAGFTPAEIRAAQAAGDAAVRAAGCNPEQLAALRAKGVSARRIVSLSGCTAAALKAAGFDAKSLLDAGFTPTQLMAAGFTPADIKAAGTALDAAVKAAGCDEKKLAELRSRGVSARRIVNMSGCSVAALQAAGFTPSELRDAGFTPAQLGLASGMQGSLVPDSDIRAAGCDATKLGLLKTKGVTAERIKRLNGCSASALKAAGFGLKDLAAAGFSPKELLAAGYSPAELAANGVGTAAAVADARVPDCSADSLAAARAVGATAASLRQSLGCSAAALKAAGFSAKDLKDAGFTAAELKNAGFGLADLKNAGFSARALREAGFSADDLKAAGFDARALKDAGFSAADLKKAGFTVAQLKDAGYSAKEMKDAGYSAQQLHDAGYSAEDMKGAGFTASQLKNAGYSNDELRDAGFSVPDSKLASLDALTSDLGTDSTKAPVSTFGGPGSAMQGPSASQMNNNTQQLQAIIKRQNEQMADQRFQQQIQERTAKMSSAANQMMSRWKSVSTQQYTGGSGGEGAGGEKESGSSIAGVPAAAATPGMPNAAGIGAPPQKAIVKTGDVVFAVLDTSVNSDEPSPILATIVSGRLKGAKLIGSFVLPANSSKMVISFNTLSVPGAARSIPVNAYAIDPNTARTALSSRTNHHYLSRYGALFASSFLEGFGNAFQSADTTVTIGGTGGGDNITVQNGISRSALENAVIGLATLGKSWGQVAQQQFSRPTTVEVFSGTGMGILFTQDLMSLS